MRTNLATKSGSWSITLHIYDILWIVLSFCRFPAAIFWDFSINPLKQINCLNSWAKLTKKNEIFRSKTTNSWYVPGHRAGWLFWLFIISKASAEDLHRKMYKNRLNMHLFVAPRPQFGDFKSVFRSWTLRWISLESSWLEVCSKFNRWMDFQGLDSDIKFISKW